MKTEKMYSLPIRKEDFSLAVNDHKNERTRYAIDFDIEIGKPVLSAQGGVVVEVYMESNEGGPDQKYKDNINFYTNRITIKHADNEYSQYAHLAHKSEKVNVGDVVARGQEIALSGNTGYSTEPHLHFHVMQLTADKKDWHSVEIIWEKEFEINTKNNF